MALQQGFWNVLARNVFGYVGHTNNALDVAGWMNKVASTDIAYYLGSGYVFFLTDVTSNSGSYHWLQTQYGFTFNVSQNVVTTVSNGKITLTGTYTITNNGSSAFTITDVYLRGYLYNNPLVITDQGWVDLDITQLSTPLTIGANGGVGQIVYKITMDYNTNMAATTTEIIE